MICECYCTAAATITLHYNSITVLAGDIHTYIQLVHSISAAHTNSASTTAIGITIISGSSHLISSNPIEPHSHSRHCRARPEGNSLFSSLSPLQPLIALSSLRVLRVPVVSCINRAYCTCAARILLARSVSHAVLLVASVVPLALSPSLHSNPPDCWTVACFSLTSCSSAVCRRSPLSSLRSLRVRKWYLPASVATRT